MNKKMFLGLGVMLALVVIPIAAAAPSLAQNIAGNGDTLRIQDQQQLQTKDCTCDSAVDPLQTQTPDQLQTQNQTRQRLQTDCNCDSHQLQTRISQQECLQQQSNFGSDAALEQNNYCYTYQYKLQQGHKAP